MADYVFHVLHNARPEYELDVLFLLEHGQESSYEAVLQEGEQLGYGVGHQVKTERQLRDILQLQRDLGLMERRRVQLTDMGQTIAQIAYRNSRLFPEIIHFLYYTTWQETSESESCFSWSYRTLCNYLWQQGGLAIDKLALFSVVSSEASEKFQIQSISFSTNSIAGIIMWLEALTPTVLYQSSSDSETRFSRRAFCTPELFVLAVDHIYQSEEIDYGSNLLLSEVRRNAVCQLCLVEPNSFDRILDYAVAQFEYLETGVGGGWGQYVVLHQQPELKDFI